MGCTQLMQIWQAISLSESAKRVRIRTDLPKFQIISDDTALADTVFHHSVSSLQTASEVLGHKRCPSVAPSGLIAEIRLICLPSSGACQSRWQSNAIKTCLRLVQKNPRGQEMRKTDERLN